MKWLITAFEPFGGASSNSSLIAHEELKRRAELSDFDFISPLPVEFGRAWRTLKNHLESNPPYKGVLALGQAEGQAHIKLECLALNRVDARIADNAGCKPPIGKIKDGPDVHWCGIPWETYDGPSARRSYSAGTFVCNELMFHLLEWSKERGVRAGFVHIPLLESQTDEAFIGQARVADRTVHDELIRLLQFVRRL